jgi:transposase InsO family protein
MAPGQSLARARKAVLDAVARKELTAVQGAAALGISKSRFYELRHAYERYGEAGILPKPRPRGRHPRALSPVLRDQVIAYAVEHPTEGPRTIAARLRLERFGGWRLSHGSVTNVLTRAGLSRTRARLAAAEALAAAEGGPITERALRDLRAQAAAAVVHLGSDVPGEQVFFDTMYVGHLKGVGKLWQYSAVDGAASFGFARVYAGEKSAAQAAHFLIHDVVPAYAEAHIGLMEAVVDGGPEFQADFRRACARLGIRRRQLPPRSPDLNAFVERFQGSCLHLHYRSAFRYRFYDSADDVDADLAAWLRFYNFERPHRGRRLRGRCPAAVSYANHLDVLVAKGWEPHELIA